MMINKRLIGTVKEGTKYIWGNVALQWISLIANICMVLTVTNMLQNLYEGYFQYKNLIIVSAVIVVASIIRFACTVGASKMSFYSSKKVKWKLRQMIYQKLLKLGASYKEQVATSEIVQVAVEGVEQLETYFGSYLPQLFYSILAPLTLFTVLCFINVPAAIILLSCVPLIPIAIAVIQTIAKKLLAKYWEQYTTLGDSFLENLQGLTTLKIYQADGIKSEAMRRESERFRKITMKVLTMQLNSITIMDVIAYGGTALGVIVAAMQYQSGGVTLVGGLAIILLSADFFIPMRLLGSFFHIAMNGMAASEKIFRLLDLPETSRMGSLQCPDNSKITIENLRFGYEENREVIHGITLDIPVGSFIAIVGESGSGKSTVASIIMGRQRGYSGSILIGDISLNDISDVSLMKQVTYIGFDSYLFKGNVRDNLLMGNPTATDSELWVVLEKVNLADFLRTEEGLDTKLTEKGSNFSGGQRQRLALARAILHDTPIYIFDEATSNIDIDSENDIMEMIHSLARTKTVILITHRLANAIDSERIYVMQQGKVVEAGKHDQLISKNGVYSQLWSTQHCLEHYKEEVLA